MWVNKGKISSTVLGWKKNENLNVKSQTNLTYNIGRKPELYPLICQPYRRLLEVCGKEKSSHICGRLRI